MFVGARKRRCEGDGGGWTSRAEERERERERERESIRNENLKSDSAGL
jgi:hypothetical protein